MLKTKIQGALKLKKDVEAKFEKWNERSMFTVKGVKNLSQSDLDTLTLYAENTLMVGSFAGLMEPLGDIRNVLQKYKIV